MIRMQGLGAGKKVRWRGRCGGVVVRCGGVGGVESVEGGHEGGGWGEGRERSNGEGETGRGQWGGGGGGQ